MMSEIIHLYHINDLHSHFENWPRIAEFLKERRLLHQEAGDESIILDIGDHVDRVHPFSEGTLGKGNVTLLNEAGFQYVTIGNNEGITMPHEDLDQLYEQAEFKVVIANIYDSHNERPNWAIPYAVHTTKQGTRIAFIGLTAFFHRFYSELGWELSEPFAELKEQLQQIKGKADMIVILSHLGIHEDEKMAEDFPEIDIILGAHTHHVLHHGKLVHDTLLCCAGKYGFYIGQVQIQVDEQKRMIKKDAYLYDTNELPERVGEREWIEGIYRAGVDILQDKIVHLPETLLNDWFKQERLSEILCEGLKEWSEAECAFLNAGLLIEGLPKGTVTNGDIHRICPHPINPCVIQLNGVELKEILLQSRNEEWPHLQFKGFGFRGNVLGMMVYNGIDFIETNNGIVKEITCNGKELEPTKMYTLVIPDMFTLGYFFPQIQRSKNKKYLMPEFLRDILVWKLKKMYGE